VFTPSHFFLQLTSENVIILMAYIERMLGNTGVFMTQFNWKRLGPHFPFSLHPLF